MSNEITVHTPESAAFSLEPAGLGSRFLALAIDIVIQVVAVTVCVWLFGTVTSVPWLTGYVDVSFGLLMLVVAIILAGYHIFFEAIWSGRSPGKRLIGLRVVKTTGVPIGFWDVCLRNLVRIIDFLPTGYFIGIISILLSRQQRRLGDFAAGTIVVRERKSDIATVPPAATTVTATPNMSPLPDVPTLTYREQELVGEFLSRRHDLTESARADLAQKLADRLLAAGVTAEMLHLPAWASDEELLVAWYEQLSR